MVEPCVRMFMWVRLAVVSKFGDGRGKASGGCGLREKFPVESSRMTVAQEE